MKKLKIKENYGVTPNSVLNDPDISYKAKGIYGYIQSKPEGWKFSARRMADCGKDGESSIQSGLKELEDNGYLVRVKYQKDDGTWGWDYELTVTRFSSTGKSSTGLSSDGKPRNISNKDIVKKNSKKDIDIPVHDFIHSFSEYWSHNPNALYNKTQFSALWDLEKNIGRDRLLIIIGYVDKIHKENPEYAPKIYNPTQLVEKYNQLIDFAKREGWEKDYQKPKSVYRNL